MLPGAHVLIQQLVKLELVEVLFCIGSIINPKIIVVDTVVGIFYTDKIRPNEIIIYPTIISHIPPIDWYGYCSAIAIGFDKKVDIAVQFNLNVSIIDSW